MYTSLYDVQNLKITRSEHEYEDHTGEGKKYIQIGISGESEGKTFVINLMGKTHDTWTDATKELTFRTILPTTIIAEKEELPF